MPLIPEELLQSKQASEVRQCPPERQVYAHNPSLPTGLEVADLCDAAADVLDHTAWRQNNWTTPEADAFCLWGAVRWAAGAGVYAGRMRDKPHVFNLLRLAADQLNIQVDDKVGYLVDRKLYSYSDSMVRWNDMPGRTKDEVTGLLRDTAKKLRAREEGIDL